MIEPFVCDGIVFFVFLDKNPTLLFADTKHWIIILSKWENENHTEYEHYEGKKCSKTNFPAPVQILTIFSLRKVNSPRNIIAYTEVMVDYSIYYFLCVLHERGLLYRNSFAACK